jgi:hypothetical protein
LSGNGEVEITGTGGAGTGSDNSGVVVLSDATIGSIIANQSITVTGTARGGTGRFGVSLRDGGVVRSQTGAVLIDGKKSSGGLSGDVQLNGAVTTAGGDITIQADRDILGDANGDISTGSGAGNITLTADQDGMNAPNDAGSIHLAGDLDAGTGEIVLELTDTDGFLNGNIVSAGRVVKQGLLPTSRSTTCCR